MAVYIDDFRSPFNGMVMCHMIADTTEDLLAMVDRIGVKREWIQKAGTHREHFDICLSKRRMAVAEGAIEVSSKNLARIMNDKKKRVKE